MNETAEPSPLPVAPNPKDILEQYKAYLQDLGNIGTRYTTSNAFYLSIITALLGLLALTKPGEGLADLKMVLGLAVPAFAIILCGVWYKAVAFYKALFKIKFDVLRDLEDLAGLHNAFRREEKYFLARPWLLRTERNVPVLLALPFVLILIDGLWKFFTHES
jgi:hypothetical protein